jgi:hypothetical protein
MAWPISHNRMSVWVDADDYLAQTPRILYDWSVSVKAWAGSSALLVPVTPKQ